MKKLFKPGQVVATAGVSEFMDNFPGLYTVLLTRHLSGDWGDVPADDAEQNQLSVEHGFRILSCYQVNDKKIWVITESDRSTTTFLFPEEY